MVTITERAKNTLLQLKMSAELGDPNIGLRLARRDAGQVDLFADVPQPGDLVVEHQGNKLLFIDREVTDTLQGATIDCRAAPGGVELIVARTGDDRLGTGSTRTDP